MSNLFQGERARRFELNFALSPVHGELMFVVKLLLKYVDVNVLDVIEQRMW